MRAGLRGRYGELRCSAEGSGCRGTCRQDDRELLQIVQESGVKFRILGCGTSTGVPKIGNDWGLCDPDEPRNYRLRTSILVESGKERILVDCGPDLRQQLLSSEVARLGGVIVHMRTAIIAMASTSCGPLRRKSAARFRFTLGLRCSRN